MNVLTVIAALAVGVLPLKNWQLRSAAAPPDSPSLEVTVPTTVLAALVENGVYPDPGFGMDNFNIPDASEPGSPFRDPWIYRTEFSLPPSMRGKPHIWLHLDGINYRADITLNGNLIASKDTVVGMFRRFVLDIAPFAYARGRNVLEVKIYQVDHPGVPSPGRQWDLFKGGRGNAGDIFLDETLKFSGGWDCAPVVRDRNIGIYQNVYITASGEVTVRDPYVWSEVPELSKAVLHIEGTLENLDKKAVKGILKATVTPPGGKPFTLSKSVVLASGEKKTVSFDPCTLNDPALWWPNGYGGQPLYTLDLNFSSSDAVSTTFGVREVRKYLMDRDGEKGLVFTVNGQRIFCRGGWLQPDMMLRNSRKNIFDQARLLANANINLVGSEDMPSPGEDWLESWDTFGLMDWHVFHQCYRMYPGRANAHNPADHDLAAACVRDEILRYRNHPSIIAWFGVNEVMVDEDLYVATKEACRELDPSRPFIPTTSTSWDIEELTPWILGDLPTGTTDDGAPDYNWAPSEYYFSKVKEVYLQMFRNEMGMPSMPVYRNLKRFIPTLDRPLRRRDPLFPLDSIWAEHGAWDANNFCYRGYDNAIRTLYSDPVSAKDYAWKGQIVSAEGYRAMFEAANHRMWDITSGVMLWKLNSCWPDVCWQIYDWYLTPTAAYYFTKKALEPVHIQMNADTRVVSVINVLPAPAKGLTAKVTVYGNDLKAHWNLEKRLDAEAESFTEIGSIPFLKDISSVALVKMTLEDRDGKVISDNLYWYYTQHQNFYWLTTLEKADLKPSFSVERDGEEYVVSLTLSNDTENLSFFREAVLLSDGKPVDPVFWDDNFVTLFPGQTRTLTARVAAVDAPGAISIEID